MNKAEFVTALAEKTGTSKKVASENLNAVLDIITDTIKNDENIVIPGFGKFYVAEVAAREARNPSTGETIMVEAHKTPKFKFASNIKADIR